jgi:CRP/FNR family transcriptional regulator, cyclic AMP receptor protein
MIDRFTEGPNAHETLIRALLKQTLVEHDENRANFLADHGEVVAFERGAALMTYGDSASDVFFTLVGAVRVHVHRRDIAPSIAAGHHFGEMAALEPLPRSATVTALEPVIALKVDRTTFISMLEAFPACYKELAREFSRRLERRNQAIARNTDKINIFAISSAEAIPVARSGFVAFEHDKDFKYNAWPIDVFKSTSYPLDDLEDQLQIADIAIAIAQPDDIVNSRKESKPVARDNVIFELGLFMGRLGRKKTIVLVPEGMNLSLPSDLNGLSTVRYPRELGDDPNNAMATAWEHVRRHIRKAMQ